MEKIQYNGELFDLLKDLTAINTQVIIEKEEDGSVLVKRMDSESTIAYKLNAPKEYFNIDQDQVAFYNYPEFYQYFRALGEPEMSITDRNIVLKDGGSKSNYLLSDPDTIQPGPKVINFSDPDVRVNLSSKDLDEMLKMIGLINSKKASIKLVDGKIVIKIFNNIHDNTFEKTFDAEVLTDGTDDIDFVIFSDTFKDLPPKRDYVIEIKSQGLFKIGLVDENISLEIFTGKVKG